MKRYLLSICLFLLASSASTNGMMLQGDPAKQFLALLQNEASINSIDNATMQTIGKWLDGDFDIQRYNALPLTDKKQFLYGLFPTKEKYFKIGEVKYSICRKENGTPLFFEYNEAEMLTPHSLPDAVIPSDANLNTQSPDTDNLPSASSIALDRASRAFYTVVQSPYFKSTCVAAAIGIAVYYWTNWTNKGKKERRRLPAKKLAISAAVLSGVLSFSYFDRH